WRVKNRATTMAYDWQHFSFGYNERFGEFPEPKSIMRVGQEADATRNVKELAPFVAGAITDDATQQAVKKVKKMRSDILRGTKSTPTYRRDGSLPMRARYIKNLVRISPSKYTVKLS